MIDINSGLKCERLYLLGLYHHIITTAYGGTLTEYQIILIYVKLVAWRCMTLGASPQLFRSHT